MPIYNPPPLGTPGTLTSATTNAASILTHTHAITLAPALLGTGAMQYQTIITGASPFAPVYSGFLLDGTTGGKTILAVTNTKTLTLTSTGDFNLTIPATGTAALLTTTNTFTVAQMIDGTADAIQLRVQGHSTQTSNLQTWENSSAGVLASISGLGVLTQTLSLATPAATTRGYFLTVDFSSAAVDFSGVQRGIDLTLGAYGSAGATNGIVGFNFSLTNYDTGTMAAIYANNGIVGQAATSGTINLAICYRGMNRTTNAGTIGEASVFYALTPTKSSTGVITTNSGVKVLNQGLAGTTTSYGVWIAAQSASTTNYALLAHSGIVVLNEDGDSAADFRVESDTYNAIFVDASDDSVVLMSNAAGKVGFFGHAAAVQPAAYTPSNVTPDRSYDANSTSLDEVADVLGTLIADLKSLGLVG